ncbi:MAG TPA: sensor histidine kinase, partial [Lactobacillus sp.]|nr:sensor histidine kinase [Lactobacillus sp.]
IWVEVTQTPRDWQLIVGNSGPNIADADKSRIFERFYREDASRSRQTGGSGLGLAIARWIVTIHHGHIEV